MEPGAEDARELHRALEQSPDIAVAVQAERERISRDLHDHVGAQLSNLISGVELIHLAADAGESQRVRRHLKALDSDARETMTQLRETIWALHQDTITLEELGHQVQRFLKQQVQYRTQPSAACHVTDGATATLSPVQALNLYRIIQEAVTNALKHACAERIEVQLRVDAEGWIEAAVVDNGRGLTKSPETALSGYGMTNMQHRTHDLGGTFEVDNHSPSGTKICVRVPPHSPA